LSFAAVGPSHLRRANLGEAIGKIVKNFRMASVLRNRWRKASIFSLYLTYLLSSNATPAAYPSQRTVSGHHS
jgi:hypothetical protein